MKRIVLVCTGNTCRSPMAEGLSKVILEQLQLPAEVLSAGTYAMAGNLASEAAIEVLRDEGLDISNHRARPLTPELLAQADLILAMTRMQRQQILQLFPQAEEKVYILKELAEKGLRRPDQAAADLADAPEEESPGRWDIPDPLGYPASVYREVMQELKVNLYKAFKHLKEQEEAHADSPGQ